MSKNKFLLLGAIALALSLIVLAGCDSVTGGNGSSSGVPGPALRAVAVAASTSLPKVLDSYTNGTNNFYLIDVGYIGNTYVSTILAAHYNGQTPVSTSRTTVSTTTITQAVTETVSTSITTSDTQNHTVGIEAAWKKNFPVVGEFSAKLKYEWAGSWTNSTTNSKTIETSSSKVESFADSQTNSFTIGEHGEKEGWYRYAAYAVCDVYFLVVTNLDNSQLVSWDTVVSAREGTLLPHMDYSADGLFDNSPANGKTINFSEEFFKTLPIPTTEAPPVVTSKTICLNDGGAITCYENSGDMHTGYYLIGLDFTALKAADYKTIKIEGDFDAKAHALFDTGDGRDVWLEVDDTVIWQQTYNIDSLSWRNKTFSKPDVPIAAFNNASRVRFGFRTKDIGPFSNSGWDFGTAGLTFTAVK